MLKLLGDQLNHPSEFKTKKWIEINSESGT